MNVDTTDSLGRTPLHWSSMNGKLEVMKILIDKGANVNAPDHEGGTPLHWSSAYGHIEAMKLLVNKGRACKRD